MSMVTIPDHWSGEEALVFVAFLEETICAIWRKHEHQMKARLLREERLRAPARIGCPHCFDPDPANHEPGL